MRRGWPLRAVAWQAGLASAWLVAAALGCHAESGAAAEGRLSIRWLGPDTAALSAPAVAEWCASLHLLEVRAIAGDTGAGIVLYPSDSIGPGVYPVRRPEGADSAQRPSAAVALRWFSKTTIMGYQADTGRVTVERTPDGRLAGRFGVGARPLVTGARLTASGTFEDLRIVTAPVTCAGRQAGDTAARARPDEAAPDTPD